ncbi:helix-turn-helix domain-containing protein [Nocardia otitidiscaviarum]|uniref:helix-turn-helix domain-containing protein n=1 Tax=Nocardia otitidiscaviarum TaxID=1823 RepID=UPI0024541D6F|nr:helix-turn-helix transcriptional regulator [Nocardia otitidiscaviarum]
MVTEKPTPSLPHRQMGRYLRRARESQNLSQGQVAAMADWSVSTQSRLERGEVGRLRQRDIELVCRSLGLTDDETAAMAGMFKQGAEKTWWHSFGDLIPESFNVYIELENEARTLEIYRPDLVPGLLQTAGYARVLDRIYFPYATEEEQARRIELRMKRQRIITRRASPVVVDAVLHEAVVHSQVGDRVTMAAQMRHLAELGASPNVSIRVLPFSAGFPVGGPVGPFVVLGYGADGGSTAADPTVVYVEGFTGDLYLEGRSQVQKYSAAWATIHRAALDVVASRTLLRQRLKEFMT